MSYMSVLCINSVQDNNYIGITPGFVGILIRSATLESAIRILRVCHQYDIANLVLSMVYCAASNLD